MLAYVNKRLASPINRGQVLGRWGLPWFDTPCVCGTSPYVVRVLNEFGRRTDILFADAACRVCNRRLVLGEPYWELRC